MRIIIDTNIVISGSFFVGALRKFLVELKETEIVICANKKIVSEYFKTASDMINAKKGNLNLKIFLDFLNRLELIEPISDLKICRDSDDDKFINCAIDAKAIYIVSGDKDLLTIKNFAGIEIVTAREFYERYF